MATKKEKAKDKRQEKETDPTSGGFGLIDPNLTQNPYQRATAAARRARQLTNGAVPMVTVKTNQKNTITALQEITEGKWKIVVEESQKRMIKTEEKGN